MQQNLENSEEVDDFFDSNVKRAQHVRLFVLCVCFCSFPLQYNNFTSVCVYMYVYIGTERKRPKSERREVQVSGTSMHRCFYDKSPNELYLSPRIMCCSVFCKKKKKKKQKAGVLYVGRRTSKYRKLKTSKPRLFPVANKCSQHGIIIVAASSQSCNPHMYDSKHKGHLYVKVNSLLSSFFFFADLLLKFAEQIVKLNKFLHG